MPNVKRTEYQLLDIDEDDDYVRAPAARGGGVEGKEEGRNGGKRACQQVPLPLWCRPSCGAPMGAAVAAMYVRVILAAPG